ncbi:hybrid sensor histidine kinase/response regulator, partial [Cognatilysobacter segetis]|uniref:ATP-binding response regulator n=1 Tax=Cognatilysobacter segetis TaxID=2492394 RepID=UPI00105F36ED
LVAWNRRYAELFGYPTTLLQVGRPIADLARWALQRIGFDGDVERALDRRLAFMRAGTPHLSERVLPDGSIIEIRGVPMPGGGFVATFTDVTAFRRAQAGLLLANETLEQRVAERTVELQVATREAERANHAKSRFLAAIGHDLMQPLHAAQLFVDALGDGLDEERRRATITQVRGALESTVELLSGLLDMSRLEAGGLVPQPRVFALAEVLDPLASEFEAIAAARGLSFRYLRTTTWVRTDPQLLRRVLQNFLANAVRYTASGRVVFGVRRCGDRLRIEVHDSGPGIDPSRQREIFEEFRRGEDAPGQGLGLGLFIADRIAALLAAPIALRSRPGRGTMFALDLECAARPQRPPVPTVPQRLAGLRVLLLDNEPAALDATRLLLERWGCDVAVARDRRDALAACDSRDPAVWLLDYHLDDGDTGPDVARLLEGRFGRRPTLVVSADASPDVRARVEDAGYHLLPKPLKPLALKSLLDRLVVAGERAPPVGA